MNNNQRQLAEGVLFVDLYELTMAQVYFRQGIHETTAQFDYFFRSYPDYGLHQAGYCINAGLEWLLDWMRDAHFDPSAISYLSSLKDAKGNLLFTKDFISYIKDKSIITGLSMQAIPEGRVVHPYVPLAIVQGPLLFAQLIETSLLNHLNYQTLIATKAARIYESGMGQMMLEFGLRRAQDRAASAGARAAIIGGASGSSNVGASAVLGFSPSGTHAHSMVQAMVALGGSELDAFRAYADMYPDNCILLVDTFNTLGSGIPNAIKVFNELKKKGHKPIGIRLDSGDLAYLSIQAARILNKAGFPDTTIVLSNQLDELVIWQIITQIKDEADRYDVDANALIKRLAFGVGTRMITSSIDPALDGVYKLVALQEEDNWIPTMKISENPEKTLNPGNKNVWRIYDKREKAIADVISIGEEDLLAKPTLCLHHPNDPSKFRSMQTADLSKAEPLLVKIISNGEITYQSPSLKDIRKQREVDMEKLYPGVKRLMNPHHYHVSLTDKLWNLKKKLMIAFKNGKPENNI
ncbi:MAG: nicotinate phosphoribosyltransferase [Anaerolineaceae bacterium]|nr:nicotinate phosphoribosyltransferase [Anaerolineaceae bacterium]